MPINAEIAVNNAVDFARRNGYAFVRVVSVRKVGRNWEVRLDTGAFRAEYRMVVLNDNGNIIGFSK